jgi:hypothetical protein
LAWSKVTRPKELGGLDLFDLKLFGWALRVRWLWLQKSYPGRPWAIFPLHFTKEAVCLFNSVVYTEIGNGLNTLFWTDKWLHGHCIQELAPAVFASIPRKVTKSRLVKDALTNLSWVQDVQGALSYAFWVQFLDLAEILEGTLLQPNVQDRHVWRFSSSGDYSSKSAYTAMFHGSVFFKQADRIWKTWAPSKCRFFLWLVGHNKCWTADRLAKRGLTQSLLCPLCDQHDETINHLLVGCSFARHFWFELLRPFGLQDFLPGQDIDDFDHWWCFNSARLGGLSKKGFDSLVALGAWMLWKHRNGVVFNGSHPNLVVAVRLAREEAFLWSLAGIKDFSYLLA